MHLIFERWADHGLGEVRATPPKDTVLFRANWTRILRDSIYVVEDKANTMASSLAKRCRGLAPYASSARTTRSGTNNLPFGQW